MKLSIKPFPKEGQSPACYVRDLARANGFGSEENFKRQFFDRAVFESEELTARQLCILLARGPEHIEGLQLTRCDVGGEPVHEFGSMRIPSYHLRRGEWYCPYCLHDQQYMLAKWKIGWLPLCTKHNCALVEADMRIKKALFHRCDVPMVSAANDSGLFNIDVFEAQRNLEDRIEKESKPGAISGHSVVDEVDRILEKSLVLGKATDLWARKKRYSMRYYPLRHEHALKFMECMAVQLAA